MLFLEYLVRGFKIHILLIYWVDGRDRGLLEVLFGLYHHLLINRKLGNILIELFCILFLYVIFVLNLLSNLYFICRIWMVMSKSGPKDLAKNYRTRNLTLPNFN